MPFNQSHYDLGKIYQQENNRDAAHAKREAACFFALAIQDVTLTELTSQDSRQRIQHAIQTMEDWLARQNRRIFPRFDTITSAINRDESPFSFVTRVLAQYYNQPYVNCGSISPENAALQSSLHTLWQTRKHENKTDQAILSEIYQIKSAQPQAPIAKKLTLEVIQNELGENMTLPEATAKRTEKITCIADAQYSTLFGSIGEPKRPSSSVTHGP